MSLWSGVDDEVDHTVEHGTLEKESKYAMIGKWFGFQSFSRVQGSVNAVHDNCAISKLTLSLVKR